MKPGNELYKILSTITVTNYIESMISLREAPDEEGIWHDDGSRELGFSLSLCLEPQNIKRGNFFLRNKESERLHIIKPSPIGTFTCFLTGKNGYEHRVEEVESGSRLMFVGWCSSEKHMFSG